MSLPETTPDEHPDTVPVQPFIGDDSPTWRAWRDLETLHLQGLLGQRFTHPCDAADRTTPGQELLALDVGIRLLDDLGLHGAYEAHVRAAGISDRCPTWCGQGHPRAVMLDPLDSGRDHTLSSEVLSFDWGPVTVEVSGRTSHDTEGECRPRVHVWGGSESLTAQQASELAAAIGRAARMAQTAQPVSVTARAAETARMLDGWAVSRRARGLSEGTIRLHLVYVRLLGRECDDLRTVTTAEVEAWMGAHPKWKPETRRAARTAVRGFFKWAQRAGLRPDNPVADLDAIRVPEAPVRPVPEDQLDDLLARLPRGRARLMVLLAAHAGLRVHEIAKLHTRDLSGDLLTVQGKGGRTRLIPIGGELLAELQACREGYVFPSRHQQQRHLSESRVGVVMGKVMPPGYTPHKLRTRYATRIYRQTGDLLSLQALLGHSNPATTRRYVLTDLDQLRAVARAARPA